MSGASGKVPAAIHLTPEATDGGLIGRIETGDLLRLDAEAGVLELLVPEETLAKRKPWNAGQAQPSTCGRGLFQVNRSH